MRNNGFTLIELLAVIVILAIISLIAVPILINVISDYKIQAIKISAENYVVALEQSIAKKNLNEEYAISYCSGEVGTYLSCMDSEGKTVSDLTVELDGLVPSDVEVYFKNNCIEKDSTFYAKINEYTVTFDENERIVIGKINTKVESNYTGYINGYYFVDGLLANLTLDNQYKYIEGKFYKNNTLYTGFYENKYFSEGLKDNYEYELYYDFELGLTVYRVVSITGDGNRNINSSSSSGGSSSTDKTIIGTKIFTNDTTGTVLDSSGNSYRVPAGYTLKDFIEQQLFKGSNISYDEDNIKFTVNNVTYYFVSSTTTSEISNALLLSNKIENNFKYVLVKIINQSGGGSSSGSSGGNTTLSKKSVGGRIYYDSGNNGATYTFYDENGNVINYDGTIESLKNATEYTVDKTVTTDRFYVFASDTFNKVCWYGGWKYQVEWSGYTYPSQFGFYNVEIGSGKTYTKKMLGRSKSTGAFTLYRGDNVLSQPDENVEMTVWSKVKELNSSNYNGCNDWFVGTVEEYMALNSLSHSELPFASNSLHLMTSNEIDCDDMKLTDENSIQNMANTCSMDLSFSYFYSIDYSHSDEADCQGNIIPESTTWKISSSDSTGVATYEYYLPIRSF